VGPPGGGTDDDPHFVYAASSDGMVHAFHSKTGEEAFAYIPQDMLPRIRTLFVQGGQNADPGEHLYGPANSPKVKRICVANCDGASKTMRTALIVPQGFGGDDLFALDIEEPMKDGKVKTTEAPVTLLWHSEHAAAIGQASEYDKVMGQAISVPGHYHAFLKKDGSKEDRLIFASGYTDETSSKKGLAIVNAAAADGSLRGSPVDVSGDAGTCANPKVDKTEPTLLTDVAVARNYGQDADKQIAAAYLGDTWGNLYRYSPKRWDDGRVDDNKQGTLSVVKRFGCGHPLHFAPTVVQPDHDLNVSKENKDLLYLVQVTNSAMDPVTIDKSTAYPTSQMVILRDKQPSFTTVEDASFAPVVLSPADPAQICGELDAETGKCTAALGERARPTSTPLAVLKINENKEVDGFILLSLWYVPDQGGCTKGATYAAVHRVDSGTDVVVKQIEGEKLGDEPVVGAVVASGKLVVATADGPKIVSTPGLGQFSPLPPGTGSTTTLIDRYRQVNWTELP
jgi:hypothetical protein